MDKRVMDVLDFMSERAWSEGRELLYLTCIVRKNALSANDTHLNQRAPYRFVDVGMLRRCDNEAMRMAVNGVFPYGDGVHETVPPLNHGTAPHHHIQVRHKEG